MRYISILGLILYSLVFFGLRADASSRKTVQDHMQKKLAYAQSLLNGLVMEDFNLILESSKQLKDIAKATTWHKSESPEFLHQSKSFSNAVDNMIEQATAKNLEGVAMSYVGLTFSCMQCHNEVRAGRKPK